MAEDLETFLSNDTNSIVCTDMGFLINELRTWLTGSQYKMAQKSLEAFSELIKRLGSDFKAYTATVLPHVIDRLGDNRDTVREKAQLLLRDLVKHRVLPPQTLIDKLATSCFKHRNAKVTEDDAVIILDQGKCIHPHGDDYIDPKNIKTEIDIEEQQLAVQRRPVRVPLVQLPHL
ncbi:hypothetical protein KR059_009728 [Drosophila kikkawai]|nr:hypothetical protein KR059_009728 [Drosophila kikkawai]